MKYLLTNGIERSVNPTKRIGMSQNTTKKTPINRENVNSFLNIEQLPSLSQQS